jgi:hypothetical protein
MNFELAQQLSDILKTGNLDKAIQLAEYELKQLGTSPFHKILSRDLLHLKIKLLDYIDSFHKMATKFFERDSSSFLSNIFKAKRADKQQIQAIYCEMNGFSINYDLWFLDLFAYTNKGGFDDLDWLSDFQYSSETSMTITGFEDLQTIYQDFMENERWQDKQLQACSDICEFLIILRLQELFRETFNEALAKNNKWASIPILVTAHDYDIIYCTTK